MKTITYENAVLEVELYAARQANKEYDVFLIEGEWPEDDDLITLVDGGQPNMRRDELLYKSGDITQGDEPHHRIVTINQ